MTLSKPLIFVCYLLSLIICCFIVPLESIGFTLLLMQANFSAKSLFYNSNLRSPVHQEFGHYYITKIQIGTPPTDQFVLVDTGSEVLWIQCLPCEVCYDQGRIPFFDPAHSSSSTRVPCGQACELAIPRFKCPDGQTCMYAVNYGGHSTTLGVVKKETLTFQGSSPGTPPVIVPDNILGCGVKNQGSFSFKGHDVSGIMGLNMGSVSFASQLSNQIHGHFSHCLAYKDYDAEATPTSLLIFGDDAILPPSRRGDIQTIDIIPGPNNRFFNYNVELVGISVGTIRIRSVTADSFKFRADGTGGCMFDTGANTLYLEEGPYKAVMKEFNRQFLKLGLRRKRSLISTSQYCYKTNNPRFERYPTMTLHFPSANYEVKQIHQYSYDKRNKYFCVEVVRENGITVIGARQMQDMRIHFDMNNKKIQFMRDNCAV